MFSFLYNKKQRGITVVEVLVGVGIASIILVMVAYSITRFINASGTVAEKTQMLYLAEDGVELVRFVRDNDWANIASLVSGDMYYLDVSSSPMQITSTPETVGNFSRSVIVQDVYRNNTTDTIVASTTAVAKSIDPNSKYVYVTVVNADASESVTLSTIITNFDI